jgi:hypothetical protein
LLLRQRRDPAFHLGIALRENPPSDREHYEHYEQQKGFHYDCSFPEGVEEISPQMNTDERR